MKIAVGITRGQALACQSATLREHHTPAMDGSPLYRVTRSNGKVDLYGDPYLAADTWARALHLDSFVFSDPAPRLAPIERKIEK